MRCIMAKEQSVAICYEFLIGGAGMSKTKTKSKTKSPVRQHISLFFKVTLLLFLVLILLAMVFFYFRYGDTLLKWQSDAKKLVKESTVDTFRQGETSLVYDDKGKLLSKLTGGKDSYYLSINDIPQSAIDCMIATEDRDFYKHKGVDIKATLSAAYQLVKYKGDIHRGGSTITQQLVKNVFLTHKQSYERKTKEIFIALEMEKKYTKDQIMEFYLNNIYFASGYYGIEAAARGYFNKSAAELDLAQIAFLCAIPNSPTKYDPFENFDNTVERKNRILDQLLSENKITDLEYSEAYYKDIKLKPSAQLKRQSSVETYVYYCATRALMVKQGFTFRTKFKSKKDREEYDEAYNDLYKECNASLYNAGYRIYTSINKQKQKKLQKSVNEALAGFTEKEEGVYKMQGAATCIDNDTGKVVAIVGGRSQKFDGYTLNRAYQSFRQPGSSFKPIAVYTPALERGYTPDTTVLDENLNAKDPDAPKNSNGVYSGNISLRYAVEQSKNVIAWKILNELTPKEGLSYVLNMGFSKIVSDDYVPAAALGGLTNGVSPVEMASAYAALENDGIYRTPTCIEKITDSQGNVIVSKKALYTETAVYKKNAARMMTDILQGVITSGTGRGLGLSNMPSAGKTGTTNDKKDGWFVGYTPYYTTSVWVGYDMPKSVPDLTGSSYPGTIWHNFMEQIHEGKTYKTFASYEQAQSTKDEGASTPKPTDPPLDDDAFWEEDPDGNDMPNDITEPDPAETPSSDEWYGDPENPDDNTAEPPNPDGGAEPPAAGGNENGNPDTNAEEEPVPVG